MRCEDFSFTVYQRIRAGSMFNSLLGICLTEQEICLTAYWGNMRCEDFSFTVYQRIRAGSTHNPFVVFAIFCINFILLSQSFCHHSKGHALQRFYYCENRNY